MAGLPPVFIEFLGHSKGVRTAIADVKAEMAGADAAGAGAFKRTGMMAKAAVVGIGVAAAGVAVKTVKMAGDFQQQMTRVRTSAGETAANMKMVSQGVLAMAPAVGQTTQQLTSGLYDVESAGYHGANALHLLKDAAEGAKVGNADLKTVTDAVTSAMNAYKLGADQSTQVTNALIATEVEGKANLEQLAGAMSSILPVASAAHVGLNEVLGAMATMTAQGTPAAVAATYLRQTIGQLSNPSHKAATEMQNLGLDAVKVGQNLGKHGLASTLTMLTDAIEKKMGPAGTVLIKHLQGAAKNTTSFQRALADLPPEQQTYVGALATMVGGTKSMQAALQLTGPHMKDFQDKTKRIAEHVKKGGKEVEGWAAVQKTFNQRVASAKASLQSLGIQIGQQLLPVAQEMIGVVSQIVSWLARHQQVAKAAAILIGVVLVAAVAALTAALYDMAAAAAVNPVTWIVLAVMALIAALVLLIMHWRQVWGFIKRIGQDVARAVVDAWNWVKDGTVGIWHSITGTVTSTWNGIASFFSSAWHTVTDPIVGAWTWLKQLTITVWNAIAGFFKKWWPLLLVIFLPFVALIIAIWNHFHKQITAVAKAVWTGIKAFLHAIWTGIKATAKAIWTGIKVVIINPVLAVWHSIKSIWQTLSGWLSSAWHGIEHTASGVWGQIKAAMLAPLTSAWHSITHLMGRIASAIGHGLHQAWNSVKNVGSWFGSIGRSIVMGIIHGVEHGASALYGSLKHLASGALSAAKSFLGINSPSKLFALHVGEAIPEGIGKGALGKAGVAHAAVRQIARGMLTTAQGAIAHVPAPRLHAAGGLAVAGTGALAATVDTPIQITLDGDVLYQAMQRRALRYERHNTSNGLSAKS
ncbi:phage tail tape measure protein [Streptomyces sp. MUM 16J]|uniref:phage tail tape measure protein n=1 Tax=Streptomyces sp. MUM 16J TaxID=2791988 RepID=UPI001F04A349|nr:phage tail tape measure protein [Streptomyces sp. MUM 16J]MCH0555820.1 phage tail tape measure protein [Streptomyces sp. MUM 16J]